MAARAPDEKIHVLVIPGTFPTSFNPAAGGFTFDQVAALSKLPELSMGVVYPALRPWTKILGVTKVQSLSSLQGVPIETETVWTIPRWWPAKNWLFQSIGRRLIRRYVDRYGRPDLVHAHFSILAGLFGLEVARELGVPLVLTEHMSTIMTNELSRWQRAAISKVARGSDQVICVGEGLKRRLHELTGVESVVVPNLTDLNRYYPSNRRSNEFSFLSVGSLNRRKRMDWVIRAFHEAFPLNQKFQLNIVGEGPEEGALKALIESLGEKERIHLLGLQGREAVARLMRDSDAFVLASSHETFGVVLIEALASDIPVIAADIDGPRDIVRPIDGILFEPLSVNSLVNALRTIIDRYPPRAGVYRLGVEERFGEDAVSKKLLSIYQSVLAQDREYAARNAAC